MSDVLDRRGELRGLVAEYADAASVVAAARAVTATGLRDVDALVPHPVEDLPDALLLPRSPLPKLVLAGGLAGGVGAFVMQWYSAVVDYPILVGGRPHFSWPAFIPLIFECTVLFGALTGVIGLFALCRLPRPHHPVFDVPGIERASQDRYFLYVRRIDPRFEEAQVRELLEASPALRVERVED